MKRQDPVCGMWVDDEHAISVEHAGERYYFCCPSCRAKFLRHHGRAAEVDASLGEGPACHSSSPLVSLEMAPAVRPAARLAKYICPMCPEVGSDVPAACPRCGMALESSTGEVGANDGDEEQQLRRMLLLAVIGTAPILVLSMGPMVGLSLESLHISPRWGAIVQGVLCGFVILFAGRVILIRAWQSVRARQLNMFTLLGLGVSVTFLASVWGTVWPESFAMGQHSQHGAVYYEAAAVMVVLVLLGQWLELQARHRTGSALRGLMELVPPTARRVRGNQVEDIPLDQVTIGDRLQIRPGDKIPVDGRVVSGSSHVDESMLTGESRPQAKSLGMELIGGTINQAGVLEMTAERIGSDTMLAQIVRSVAQAQRSRAPIERLADRVSGWFVPVVLGIALLTWIGWLVAGPQDARWTNAWLHAVAVLMIACPCALGLATPMSVIVGLGRGAQDGILIKDAAVLERMERIDTVVFDKTGTLTQGQPQVVAVDGSRNATEDQEWLRLAASAESASEHPWGRAVVAAARARDLTIASPEAFEAHVGQGIAARVEGHQVFVGSRAWFVERQLLNPGDADRSANARAAQLASMVHVAVDGVVAGSIAIADPIREGARDVLMSLREQGITCHLVTGDQADVAADLARQLSIEHVAAQVRPAAKQAAILALRNTGRSVAMVGDGINDAPALAAADVGLAMGTGSDIAMSTADVTLVGGNLRQLPRALRLGRLTMQNIRQNLALAFLYNGLSIPLASGVLVPWLGPAWQLHPMIAAAAMSFSSLSVIANALRLRHAR